MEEEEKMFLKSMLIIVFVAFLFLLTMLILSKMV